MLSELKEYQPETDNSRFSNRLKNVEECATRLIMLKVLEEVKRVRENFTTQLEDSHRAKRDLRAEKIKF